MSSFCVTSVWFTSILIFSPGSTTSISRSVKFQSRSGGLKRVATEEIIEEIKQEPDESGTRLAAVESTALPSKSATFAVPTGGSKVKKLDNSSNSSSSSFSVGVRKSSLSNLVVKKKQQQPPAAAATTTTLAADANGVVAETAKGTETKPPMGTPGADNQAQSSTSEITGGKMTATSGNSPAVATTVGHGTTVSGLGLLGAYSDSENSSDGNE